jgi:hypothetical protein
MVEGAWSGGVGGMEYWSGGGMRVGRKRQSADKSGHSKCFSS